MPIGKKPKLGKILVEGGVISEEQLHKAVLLQAKTGKRLGKAIIELGYLDEETLINVLSAQLDIPYIDVEGIAWIDPSLKGFIREEVARKYTVLPISKDDGVITVAMVDPTDIPVIDELKKESGCEISPAIGAEGAIRRVISFYYRGKRLAPKPKDVYRIDLGEKERVYPKEVKDSASDFIHGLLSEAIIKGSTDIYLDPLEREVRVTLRIEGRVRRTTSILKSLYKGVLSRFKIMTGMEQADVKVPIHGRCRVSPGDRVIGLDVWISPGARGERVAIHIFDPSSHTLSLEAMGLDEEALALYRSGMGKGYGLRLVGAPIGGPKEMVIYATLREVASIGMKTMTIEDPIICQIDGIEQMEINPSSGLTFQEGIKSIMAQYPDVIMISNMMDREVSRLAVEAAMGGRVVIGGVDTVCVGGILRWMRGVEMDLSLVGSFLAMTSVHRFINKICPECREAYTLSTAALREKGIEVDGERVELFRGKGCGECEDTGYKGMEVVSEILVFDEEIRELFAQSLEKDLLRLARDKGLYISMIDEAKRKLLKGITTLEEVIHLKI